MSDKIDPELLLDLTNHYNELVISGAAPANPDINDFYKILGINKKPGEWTSEDSIFFKAFLNFTSTEFSTQDSTGYNNTGGPDSINYNNTDSAIFDDLNFQKVLKKNIKGLASQIEAQSSKVSKVKSTVNKLNDKFTMNKILINDLSSQFDILEEGYTGVGGFFRTAFNVFEEGSPAQLVHSELNKLQKEQLQIGQDLNGKIASTRYGAVATDGGLNRDLLSLEKTLKNLQIKQDSYKALQNPEFENKE